MRSIEEQINPNFIKARTEYNQIYKNFLFISSFYEKIYKEEYVDLFTASTFSKVVPEIITEEDYINILSANNSYKNYPSPEGDAGLIMSFIQFIKQVYNLDFSKYGIMVCQGTMQAIDAISYVLKGKIVFVMDSTVTFAKSIPTANGATIVSIKTNNGILDINDMIIKIQQYKKEDIMYLYLNYPNNPTGAQITEKELHEIINITQEHGIKIVHDHDICLTTHNKEKPVISIFKDKRASNNSIEIYTLSKEFGLSGLRVGLIVGNKEFIEMIKCHNYETNVMIPLFNQKIAELALKRIDVLDVQNRIQRSMKVLVEGFRDLGWENICNPQAGISFLLSVPKAFEEKYKEKSGELFAFYLQKEHGIGVGPASCNCLSKNNYVRILSMEPEGRCKKMFDNIKGYVSPQMIIPKSLYNDYVEVIGKAEKENVR